MRYVPQTTAKIRFICVYGEMYDVCFFYLFNHFQKTFSWIETYIGPGWYPDKLAGFGVADLVAGAHLPGKRAKILKVNPLAFL